MAWNYGLCLSCGNSFSNQVNFRSRSSPRSKVKSVCPQMRPREAGAGHVGRGEWAAHPGNSRPGHLSSSCRSCHQLGGLGGDGACFYLLPAHISKPDALERSVFQGYSDGLAIAYSYDVMKIHSTNVNYVPSTSQLEPPRRRRTGREPRWRRAPGAALRGSRPEPASHLGLGASAGF